jgi:hypothetical protein
LRYILELRFKKDEDIEMRRRWWKCPENQWQCRSEQCIEIEWDCIDALDEEAIFVPFNNFFSRNLSVEYRCFRVNISDPLNITRNTNVNHNLCIEYFF